MFGRRRRLAVGVIGLLAQRACSHPGGRRGRAALARNRSVLCRDAELASASPGTILRSRQVTVDEGAVPVAVRLRRPINCCIAPMTSGQPVANVTTVIVPTGAAPAGGRKLISVDAADTLSSRPTPNCWRSSRYAYPVRSTLTGTRNAFTAPSAPSLNTAISFEMITSTRLRASSSRSTRFGRRGSVHGRVERRLRVRQDSLANLKIEVETRRCTGERKELDPARADIGHVPAVVVKPEPHHTAGPAPLLVGEVADDEELDALVLGA